MTPDRTIAFMQEIEKPWIAFKVLAAGGIRPESGFRYAFEHGADFMRGDEEYKYRMGGVNRFVMRAKIVK
jgi:hypothetical protein